MKRLNKLYEAKAIAGLHLKSVVLLLSRLGLSAKDFAEIELEVQTIKALIPQLDSKLERKIKAVQNEK